ncbi:MAG: type II toxin-antitoxin system PrlF family antitoxin [Candidatus Sumerlaeia bacterium]
MSIATITTKGQITIPKDVRERLGLRTGDKVNFKIRPDGSACMQPVTLRPEDVFGMLKGRSRVRATIRQMDENLAEAIRKGKP